MYFGMTYHNFNAKINFKKKKIDCKNYLNKKKRIKRTKGEFKIKKKNLTYEYVFSFITRIILFV